MSSYAPEWVETLIGWTLARVPPVASQFFNMPSALSCPAGSSIKARAIFASKIELAIAGLEDDGGHALWKDISGVELPTADLLLVFGVAWFVLVSKAFLALAE